MTILTITPIPTLYLTSATSPAYGRRAGVAPIVPIRTARIGLPRVNGTLHESPPDRHRVAHPSNVLPLVRRARTEREVWSPILAAVTVMAEYVKGQPSSVTPIGARVSGVCFAGSTPATYLDRIPVALFDQGVPINATFTVPLHPSISIIDGPPRTNGRTPSMQRHSEPQIIAADLDKVIPDVIRIFNRDNHIDEEEFNALHHLRSVSTRQHYQAELHDTMDSIENTGFTPLNIRRIKKLCPQLDPAY